MTDPAEAGAAGDPPEDHPDAESPSGTSNSAVQQGQSHAETTIRDELSTVMPGKEPLVNLTAVQTGPVHYTVLSARSGGPTTHRVNIQRASCTCSDMEYNVPTEESRDVCAHVVYVLLRHPMLDVDESMLYRQLELLTQRADVVEDVKEIRDDLESGIAALRDAEAGAAAGSADDDGDAADETPDISPEDAASRLQGAYDDVVQDMNTKATQHYVWVQTGQDTPETLPGPGNVSVFEAFLQNAEHVHYVPDDYEGELQYAAGEKPGEWWKNAMRPEDVDEYISEVLE